VGRVRATAPTVDPAEDRETWADGYLITTASQAPGAKVWTYDREFATTWRDLDGKRVPLLVDPRAA
jgi:hypothetical protein